MKLPFLDHNKDLLPDILAALGRLQKIIAKAQSTESLGTFDLTVTALDYL